MRRFFLLLPLAWMACADPSKDDPELDGDGDGAVNGEDCAPDDAGVYPGATERCDGVDQNCDGEVDEGATGDAHYADSDGDQFGDVNVASTDCIVPTGYVADATDCDDSQAAMYPGAPEICDGLDNNCDGDVDLNATDATSWYQDLDADGYGAGEAIVACTAPADRLPTGDDCDDTNAAINPGMIEVCDPLNVDEDCNGMADDADQSADPSTWTSSWVDADGDGYGDPSLQLWTCEIPAGCVTDGSDCDDADGELWSGSPGLCDVVLVSKDVYRQEDGTETEVAVDPYTDYLAVEAWVGGASVASGQLVDAGRVEIAGVPAGPYTLFRESLPGSTWVAGARGNQVWVDMPSRMYSKTPIWAGRSNVSSATQATMVELDATGLSPLNVQTWVEASGDYVGANDLLEFYSYNADALLTVVLDPEDSSLGAVPAAGDTVLNGLSLDWSDAVSYVNSAGPLVDAAQGDGLVVTHLAGTRVQDSSRSDGWADFTWYTPVDSVSLSQTFVDGGSHLLQVAFSPAPSSPFDLDFRGDSFSAELEARGPAHTGGGTQVAILRDPGSPAPIVGIGPTLLSLSADSVDDGAGGLIPPGDLSLSLNLGDPYTAGTPLVFVYQQNYLWFTDPHSGTSDFVRSYITQYSPAAGHSGVPVEPLLGLVQNLALSGQTIPADSFSSGTGLTPTVTFDPPAIGTPDYYNVAVVDLEDFYGTNGSLLYRRRTIANILTTDTSVSLPAGLLSTGSYYKIEVQAVLGIDIDADVFASATTVTTLNSTGPFTP